MAREALAQEDKILSENYFQHADHFTRVQNELESNRISRTTVSPVEAIKPITAEVNVAKPVKTEVEVTNSVKTENTKKVISVTEVKKAIKNTEKKAEEEKTATS